MFSACLEFYCELTLETSLSAYPVKAITTNKHTHFVMQIDKSTLNA